MSTLLLRVAALPVLLLLALLAPGCDKHAEDKAAIRLTMKQLLETIETNDGELAASLTTAESFEHYPRLIRLALHGKRDELERLNPSDLSEVLLMRHMGTARELEGLDGRAYLVLATSRGWYSDESIDLELERIRVTGDSATASVLVDGEATELTAVFRREDGVWKFHEPPWYEQLDEFYAEAAAEEDVSMSEYLLMELETDTGKTPTEAIWRPMRNPVGSFGGG